jgi:SAM-dependent methyltransferase
MHTPVTAPLDTVSIEDFYRRLAADYHFIFADWRKSVLTQSGTLDQLIRRHTDGCGAQGCPVLDCACGIGTQAIGLALRGYRVHASDLSAEAVARAQAETQRFQVAEDMTFAVADFRDLEPLAAGPFVAVIACDNALAHMLTHTDLARALHSMWRQVAPGGVLLLSIRDYDRLLLDRPRATLPAVTDDDQGRHVSFQVWDWADDEPTYRLSHFILSAADGDWHTSCAVTTLRAWQRANISAAAGDLPGLAESVWHMPDDSGYYQPVFAARKAAR